MYATQPLDATTGQTKTNRSPGAPKLMEFGSYQGNALKKQSKSAWNVPRTLEQFVDDPDATPKGNVMGRTKSKRPVTAAKKNTSSTKKRTKSASTNHKRTKSMISESNHDDNIELDDDEQIKRLTREINLLKKEREELGIDNLIEEAKFSTQSFFPVHYSGKRGDKNLPNTTNDEQVLTYLHDLRKENENNLDILKKVRTKRHNKDSNESSSMNHKKKSPKQAWTKKNNNNKNDNKVIIKVRLNNKNDKDKRTTTNSNKITNKKKNIETMSSTLLDQLNFQQITKPESFSFQKQHNNNNNNTQTSIKKNIALEKKLAYLAEKKKQEEEHTKREPYRARDVPASSLIPKYEQMVRQQQIRSQEIKIRSKELTKSLQKPFKFSKSNELLAKRNIEREREAAKIKREKQESAYVYEAREVPWEVKVSMLDTMNKEQEEKRKARVKIRAAKMLAMSKLPERMAKGLKQTEQEKKAEELEELEKKKKERKKTALQAQKDREEKELKKHKEEEKKKIKVHKYTVHVPDYEKEHDFKPKLFSDKIIDYDSQHTKFQDELAKRKKKIKSTKVKEFKFRSVKKKSSKPEPTYEEKEAKIRQERQKLYENMKNQAPFYAPTTKKAIQAKEQREKQIRAREEKILAKEREEELLKKRDTDLRKRMKPFFKETKSLTDKQIKESVKAFRQSQKHTEENYKEMLANIKLRVSKRPLLIETDKQEAEKIEARRKALLSIKESLDNAGITDYKSYFDEDELEDMGIL